MKTQNSILSRGPILHLLVLTFLWSLVFMLDSCCLTSCDQCPSLLVAPASVIPYQTTYHLGDTLTFDVRFYKELMDENSGEVFDVSSLSIPVDLYIYYIGGDSAIAAEKDYIEFLKVDSRPNISIDTTSWSDICQFENDTFFTSIRFVLKRKGMFLLRGGPDGGGLINENPFGCRLESAPIEPRLNSGRDNNIHLLEQSPDTLLVPRILQDIERRFYRRGSFAYKVE